MSEGFKVVINIATNDAPSRTLIAKTLAKELETILKLGELSSEEEFLVTRLLFLLSVDLEGASLLASNYDQIEFFVNEKLKNIPQSVSDEDKIIIEIMRYRYNLLRHGLLGYSE